jgi:hypothetical protein
MTDVCHAADHVAVPDMARAVARYDGMSRPDVITSGYGAMTKHFHAQGTKP